MIWTIEYDILVQKQIKKLDPQTRNRIRWFLHERLTQLDNPRTLGNALKGSELGNYRRYRIL